MNTAISRRKRLLLAAITVAVLAILTAPLAVENRRHSAPDAKAVSAPHPLTEQKPQTPAPRAPRTSPSVASDVPAAARKFAATVAALVFTWDTTRDTGPLANTATPLSLADPNEAAGLATDLPRYLPSAEAWKQLRQWSTRQWLTITSIKVPQGWNQSATSREPPSSGVAQAAGLIAITIDGVRHRSGTWNNQLIDIERPVAFTIFLTCPTTPSASNAASKTLPNNPSQRTDGCRLLRLSRPDEPLR